jgi:hypothetical protein
MWLSGRIDALLGDCSLPPPTATDRLDKVRLTFCKSTSLSFPSAWQPPKGEIPP